MLAVLCFVLAAAASTVGALSGIGGGIIIKPILDRIGGFELAAINFLSGSTVLAMTAVALARSFRRDKPSFPLGLFLASGSLLGGIAGKGLFSAALAAFPEARLVKLTQSLLLLAVNLAVLAYLVFRGRLRTLRLRPGLPGFLTGASLGLLSSFLGIGGGPMNIAALRLLFSLGPKETVINSLFVIFTSQAANLAALIVSHALPPFDPSILALMCLGGVGGAMLGRSLSRRLSEGSVERFFLIVLLSLIALNLWNCVTA